MYISNRFRIYLKIVAANALYSLYVLYFFYSTLISNDSFLEAKFIMFFENEGRLLFEYLFLTTYREK